ncbi:cytochrome P450 9e2-like [Diprion similis]|uniref:cytochrome P450 9e2-like n=1 Tax=Diprion similis TaxID=362088 RepID=UPI001EF8EC83|nr:cytochrome P450 9e2-like [Diprion similis]
MDLWTVILTVVVGAFCAYLFFTRNHNYFKKHGIPYVKPNPIFGTFTAAFFQTKTLSEVIEESYQSHPEAKYVGCFDFRDPVILLKDPELVKSITIKNFDSFPNHQMFADSPTEPLFQKNLFALTGEAWRDMRTLLSPAFTSSKMKMMFKTMSECAINLSDYLVNSYSHHEALDMKDAFGRYTLDVIASTAFGLSVNSLKDRENEFYRAGKSVSDFSGVKMFKFFFMKNFPWLAKLFNIKILDRAAEDFFTNAIKTTIATRQAEGIVRPDMIQLMMQSKDRNEKSSLSIEDMTAQAFVFFLGGFDSPATTMSFAARLLASNPEVQKKLQAEIDRELERGAGEISYENLHGMKYLDAVVSETLRMFPPSVIMDRVGEQSFTLPPSLPGLEPLEIQPGRNVWIPCYSFHHDPKYFPDPEKFDPERFNEENKSKISPFVYFPFGLGPRICIATRFALMEVKLALFHLLATCNVSPSSKTQPRIELSTKTFVVEPKDGFWLRVEPRMKEDPL